MLDANGRIVGIVEAGVMGSGVNFAIPVARLRKFLQKPEVIFTPPDVSFVKQGQEQEYTIKVLSLEKPRPVYSVLVKLIAGGETRTIEAKPAAGGDGYSFRAVPVPSKGGSKSLQLSACYTGGSFTARVTDRPLKVGSQSIKMSDVLRIEREAGKSSVQLTSGKKLSGEIAGLSEVDVNLGEVSAALDLSKALSLSFESLDRPIYNVDYTVTVKARGEAVAELTGKIDVTGVPTAAAAVANSGEPSKITPAALEKDEVVRQLPSVVDDVIPAAGGRLLLLQMKKLRKIGVFDVSQAKVTDYIPLPADDMLCAAGADKLVLIARDQNIVQRWNLQTLQKELTAALPAATQIDSVVAGYASAGPLLLLTRNGPKFLDFATLKLIEINEQAAGFNGYWHTGRLEARASADGSTFAAWALNSSPSGIRVLTLEGNTAHATYEHNSAGALIPSYDGSLLFTTAGGIYSSDLKPVMAEQFRGSTCLPCYHPSYFLGIRFGAENAVPRSKPGNSAIVSIYTTLDKRLLVTLPEFNEITRAQQYGFRSEALPIEKRIHFFPTANLILTVGDSRDQLVLRRFTVTDALEKAGIDYLFIASTPPRVAVKGQPYTYLPDIKSKRGGVKVSLDSGPDGMTIDGGGQLHWDVPASFTGSSAGVILSVKDASGQEIYHTFNVTVR